VKHLPTIGEIRADMLASSVKVILYPDYHIRYFRDLPGVKHVQVFHGTSDKSYDYHKSVLEYDLFLIPGADAYERYRRRGLLKRGTGVLVGYPKLDRVFRGELKQADELARLGLDPRRKTVLYAPTWVDRAFNSSWKRFRKALADKPSKDVNLIIKLHPNIKRYRAREVEDLKRSIPHDRGTLLFDEAADIVPFMAASDLLAGDVSAAMREYLAFAKPMVFLSCKPGWLWSGRKKRLWDCGEVVTDPSKAWHVILEVLDNPGRYAPRIRRHLERTFFDTGGNAALRVKREVLKLLEISPCSP
jgi:CDP-glycerol glycerophosphotransferase (TagB/SpsB family)